MPGKFYKYHGAGNDFLLADAREEAFTLSPDDVIHLCDRHTGFGADGVMLLENPGDLTLSSSGSQGNRSGSPLGLPEPRGSASPGPEAAGKGKAAFRMRFYNPDGSSGMMCGNGGRCIVAFATDLGVVSENEPVVFEAPDGEHVAMIQAPDERVSGTSERIVRLKMRDVSGIRTFPDEHACFLDTGTRHLVKFVRGLEDYPVLSEGRALRHDTRFAPEGTNVNFVEARRCEQEAVLHVRTFEKGVENETLACGTGIVATALAAYSQGMPGLRSSDGRITCRIQAAIAELGVDFIPHGAGDSFRAGDIWLTGPAAFVGTVETSQ